MCPQRGGFWQDKLPVSNVSLKWMLPPGQASCVQYVLEVEASARADCLCPMCPQSGGFRQYRLPVSNMSSKWRLPTRQASNGIRSADATEISGLYETRFRCPRLKQSTNFLMLWEQYTILTEMLMRSQLALDTLSIKLFNCTKGQAHRLLNCFVLQWNNIKARWTLSSHWN